VKRTARVIYTAGARYTVQKLDTVTAGGYAKGFFISHRNTVKILWNAKDYIRRDCILEIIYERFLRGS